MAKAKKNITRSDHWKLAHNGQISVIQDTIARYRRVVQLLVGIIYANWELIGIIENQKKQQSFVEKLIHSTKKNQAKYSIFDKRFHKFPSYYRRAAISAAIGIVSSFVTRYIKWQSGIRNKRIARSPKLTANTNIWPCLYSGNCIRYYEKFIEIKVFKDNDWKWIKLPIIQKGKRHLNHIRLSPSLVIEGQKVQLSVPFNIKIKKSKEPELGEAPVAAFDLGINTGAVGSVVHSNGTVSARSFLDRAPDIDRRDKRLDLIRSKARKSKKLSEGFCRGLYRKASNINREIAQRLANDIVKFALDNGAIVIVFENLKGFRPKGGRKRSNLKQKFHGWLHRQVVRLVEQRMEEFGLYVKFVSARGTSKYAFDGSGAVKRDKSNYSLATFLNGKKYNCDLSASYNIGARYWYYRKLKGERRILFTRGQNSKRLDRGKLRTDKMSVPKSRMPITLSSLWNSKKNDIRCEERSSDHNVSIR